MTPKRVFVDSDVIISSLISTRGAAYILLNETKGVELYLSNFSILELERVTKRLDINPEKLTELVNTRLTPIKITQSLETVEEQFANYVLDPDDAHIVTGATEARKTQTRLSAYFVVSWYVLAVFAQYILTYP
jgi:predicted nucleic acid-binding protein